MHRRRITRGTTKTRGIAKETPDRKELVALKPSLPTPAAMVVEARQPMRKKVVKTNTGLYIAAFFSF